MTPPSRLLAAAKDVVLSKGSHSPDGEAGAYDAIYAADVARATVEKEAFRMLEAVIKGAGP